MNNNGEKMKTVKQKAWVKPNVVGCQYCGKDAKKFKSFFHGVYCSLKCASERSVLFAYKHLQKDKTFAEVNDWNGEVQYPKSHTG